MGGSTKGNAVGKKASSQRLDTLSGRLGAAIRARREKLNVTVDELQAKLTSQGCDVSAQTIYAWESGTRQIPINDLPAIAASLGTTIRKLMPEN